MGELPTLREKIESLVGSGASDFEISKEFKTHIKNYLQSLNEIFETDFGREFLYRHTRELDSILVEMFRYIIRDSFGDYQPLINSIPVSMVALGSYGRQQLAVYSDIDIMLLYKDVKGYQLKPLLERFLYMAWDAGLKIGHRVHEVSEIPEAVKADITIKTAILESRFIYGSRFLWTEYQNKLTQVRKTDQKEFVVAKLEEMQKRHAKYKFSMEPNIKEGIGGLRDGNTLFWLATAIYGINSNKELAGRLFSEAEYKEYRLGIEFLFKLRNALHLGLGKKDDTLKLQNQRDMALKLGFKDTKTQKAENYLVSKTLKYMRAINIFCSINCDKLARKMFVGESSQALLRHGRTKNGFYILDNTAYLPFNAQKNSLFEALKLFIEDKIGSYKLDYSIHNFFINSAAHKKQKKITKELIFNLLSNDAYHAIIMLYEAGLLSLVFPPFARILHLAQFDGYHEYPVDIHSIECLKHLENITDTFVSNIYQSFDKEDKVLLKLALLFHDIGKGSGRDHSVVGANMAVSFGKKIGLSERDIELIKRVILYHTLMSHTAFREDLSHEKTVLLFTAALKSKKAVEFLYVLTYADLKGVGKNLYTSFNASLLRELYFKALAKLENSDLVSEASARLSKESQLAKSLDFKALQPKMRKNIIGIESNLFFLKYTPVQIVGIAKKADECTEFCFYVTCEPYLCIEIISKKWFNFGKLLSRFSYLNIVSMDIFKLFAGAKYFRIYFDSAVSEEEIAVVESSIEEFCKDEGRFEQKRVEIRKNDIAFDFDHSESYVKMSLNTKNQQGLLAFVIAVFDELGIDIASAKVSTIKAIAKDIFIIEKNDKIEAGYKKLVKELTKWG